jgi:flagellar FliL protein
MSAAAAPVAATQEASGAKRAGRKGGKRKLLLPVLVLLLGGIGAGLWFSGILPRLLGHADKSADHTEAPPPTYVEMPEIIANLNGNPRHPSYVKLRAKIELRQPQDAAALQAGMPRVMDLFQSYVRDMRPEELRGTGGLYRLREELIARIDIALAPVRVQDVLFVEIIVQ